MVPIRPAAWGKVPVIAGKVWDTQTAEEVISVCRVPFHFQAFGDAGHPLVMLVPVQMPVEVLKDMPDRST